MAILLVQAIDNPDTKDAERNKRRFLAGDTLAIYYDDEEIGEAERNNPAIKVVKVDADPIDLMHLLEDPTVGGARDAVRRRAQKIDLAALERAAVTEAKTDAKLGAIVEVPVAEFRKHEVDAAVIDAAKRPRDAAIRSAKRRG